MASSFLATSPGFEQAPRKHSLIATKASLEVNHPVWKQLVAAIHDSQWQLVAAITGGGSGAIRQLLTRPGASRSVLEAVVPYAATALARWLGSPVEQACSDLTARAMAMAAWSRGRQLALDADPYRIVGLGGSASLATDRPKRGPHRIHVATQTATATRSVSLQLQKGKRDRSQEERLTACLLLVSLAETIGLETSAAESQLDELLQPGEHFERFRQQAPTTWTELLLSQRRCVFIVPDESFSTERLVSSKIPAAEDRVQATVMPKIVFPGAFNPPHEGHRQMARIAAGRLGHRVAWEMSISNVDKPTLDFIEIANRLKLLQQLSSDSVTVLTTAATFLEKSELFPNCHFIVGADTIARIADPRYYNNDTLERDQALVALADSGCQFLVFGRQIVGDHLEVDPQAGRQFQTLDDLPLPVQLLALCQAVSEEDFRADISSTELRTGNDPLW